MRAHVVLPEELIKEVDRIAGQRGRSKFIEEAIRHKVLLARQQEAMRKARGTIKLADHPEWSTPEKISEWVRNQRRNESDELDKKIERWRVVLGDRNEE